MEAIIQALRNLTLLELNKHIDEIEAQRDALLRLRRAIVARDQVRRHAARQGRPAESKETNNASA